ncbi:RloB family protein [Nocardiopsis sp. YSL2]|uniref:RloB family protein n=1 Tax=Nocardiopsis sp. YSL2 TaxID=2939492 RepID=UPI0026F47CA2|nr:RloB family protein [Nocardiopsis sp. YSL2]
MARTRGRDSFKPAKKKSQRRRRDVYVFTEGEVTEPQYIDIITKRAGAPDVEVHIANESAPGSQRKPLKLVEAAVQLSREKTREAKRDGRPKQYWPSVWCLFDRDEHVKIEAALKQAKEGGVRVAFSHPCFELWRLLHHKAVTNTFGGVCEAAAQKLPFASKANDIKVVLSDQIPAGSFAVAKKRAKQINQEYGPHVSKLLRDPYTDVYEFVEEGLGITAY